MNTRLLSMSSTKVVSLEKMKASYILPHLLFGVHYLSASNIVNPLSPREQTTNRLNTYIDEGDDALIPK